MAAQEASGVMAVVMRGVLTWESEVEGEIREMERRVAEEESKL